MDRGAWQTAVHGVTREHPTPYKESEHGEKLNSMYVYPVTQLCPTLCDPMGCSLPVSPPWNFPGKDTRAGWHFLIQGIFPTHKIPWILDNCCENVHGKGAMCAITMSEKDEYN